MDWGLIGDGGESLRAALMDLRLRDLPPQYNERYGFWTRALVLVSRVGSPNTYCHAERNARGVMRYIKDYGGRVRPISGVVSIHPYEYLDTARFGVRYESEEACRNALCAFHQRRFARLVAVGGVKKGLAYEKLKAFTDDRLRLCRECDTSDLAWLDRERIMLQMREDVSEKDTPNAAVASSDVVRVQESYGEERKLRTIDSGGAEPKRSNRGRPRKASADVPADKAVRPMKSGVVGKKRVGKDKSK